MLPMTGRGLVAPDKKNKKNKKKKFKELVATKKDWRMFTGGTFDSSTFHVIDDFPAKFTFSTTSQSCSDFVIFDTEEAPSATQASIVGFNNLYAGTGAGACGVAGGGAVPTVMFAYNTSAISTGRIETSTVLSLDGTQIAFVEGSSLILLKFATSASGTLTAPIAPTVVTNANYRTCTAPCMTSSTLNTTSGHSSPFVDYTNDILWVGNDANVLFKISGVFLGTPTLVSSATITGAVGGLAGPVFDSASGLVFVSDLTGGFLFSVNSTTLTTQVKSAHLSFNGFLNDSPLVDSGTQLVYYFSSNDAATSGHSGVFQLPTTFVAGATGTEKQIGLGTTGAAGNPFTIFSGAFDNTYFSTSGASGNLYSCGNFGGLLTLYQIPILANVMQTPITGPALTAAQSMTCTPITEFDNGTDLIFFSITDHGSLGTCNNKGCVMTFDIDSGITSASVPASDTNQGGNGGSTAMIVDNNVTTANDGGAQIYWIPLNNLACAGNKTPGGSAVTGLGTGDCAVQASQANVGSNP